MFDQITLLTNLGEQLLTKSFKLAGGVLKKTTWQDPYLFRVETREVTDLASVSKVLTEIERNPKVMAIRGALKEGVSGTKVRRRIHGPNAAFEAHDRQWLMLDLDDIELPSHLENFNDHVDELVRLACTKLPDQFHGVDCHFQFSSSMGVSQGIRLHLAFVLSKPISDAEAKRWLKNSPVDGALYNPVQPHYTAAPVFDPPEANPVRTRSGLFNAGAGRTVVDVPDLNVLKPSSTIRSAVLGPSGNLTIDPPQILRNADGKVIDGREYFMFLKSVEAAGELTKNKAVPTLEEIADLTWDLFSSEADITDGKWTRHSAADKAHARMQQIEEGHDFSARSVSHVLIPGIRPYFDMMPVTKTVGITKMQSLLGEFAEQVKAGHQTKLALRITMGSGKTKAAVDQVNDLLKAMPGLNVAIYVPRHDLASDLEGSFSNAPEGVELVHIRGREAIGPDGLPMCQRSEYVAGLARRGLSVRQNACYRSHAEQCEFYQSCAYQNQFRRSGTPNLGTVRIYAHANLGLQREPEEPIPDLVIIDESALSALIETAELPLEEVRMGFLHNERSADGNVLADAIRDSKPVLATLRSIGAVEPWLLALNFRRGLSSPAFSSSATTLPNSTNDQTYRHAKAKELMRDVLLEELATGRDDVERLRYDPSSGKVRIVRLRPLAIPDTASLLILDGTANQLITTTIFGDVRFERIDIEQKAFVTQVYDRTGSNSSYAKNPDLVEDLVNVLCSWADAGEDVLCIGNKALADQLRAMSLPSRVKTDHFGNIKGTNNYNDASITVISGRNEPPQQDVDGLGRAIFWSATPPLQHDPAALIGAALPDLDLPKELRGYITNNPDDAAGIYVRAFSDARIEAVHQQLRESESIQAVSRLRLVHSPMPKHVIILSNLPIEIPVDRLIKWADLMPDWAEKMFLEFGSVPLTPNGLMKMRPDIFDSEGKAKSWLKRSKLTNPDTFLSSSPALSRVSGVVLGFKQVKDGKATGRTSYQLFRLDVCEGVGSGSQFNWKATLEGGYDCVEGSGWGDIEIVEIEWLLKPTTEATESINWWVNHKGP